MTWEIGFISSGDSSVFDCLHDWDMMKEMSLTPYWFKPDEDVLSLQVFDVEFIPVYYDEKARKVSLFEYIKWFGMIQRFGFRPSISETEDIKDKIIAIERSLLLRNDGVFDKEGKFEIINNYFLNPKP